MKVALCLITTSHMHTHLTLQPYRERSQNIWINGPKSSKHLNFKAELPNVHTHAYTRAHAWLDSDPGRHHRLLHRNCLNRCPSGVCAWLPPCSCTIVWWHTAPTQSAKFADDNCLRPHCQQQKVRTLTSSCQNSLQLNINKTKEQVEAAGWRPHPSASTAGKGRKLKWSSFRFLGVRMTENLIWTHSSTTTETQIFRCITERYSSCLALVRKSLQNITRTELPPR